MPFKGQLALLSLVCLLLPLLPERQPLFHSLSTSFVSAVGRRHRLPNHGLPTPNYSALDMDAADPSRAFVKDVKRIIIKVRCIFFHYVLSPKICFSSLYIAREMASFLIECCFASLLRKCEAVALNPLVQCDGFVVVFKTN